MIEVTGSQHTMTHTGTRMGFATRDACCWLTRVQSASVRCRALVAAHYPKLPSPIG